MKIIFEELIEWLEKEDSKNVTTEKGSIKVTQDFALLEEIICEKCSSKQIYLIAELGLKSTNIKKLGQAVIDSKDPKYNYLFAKNINKADIKAHEQAVIDSKDPEYNYYFASDINSSDINAHGQIVIDSKNLEYNYYFARDVVGADVKAHGQVVLESKNPEYNYYFARDVVGADVKAHGQVVLESKNPTFIFWFKKTIKSFTFQFPEQSESNNDIASNLSEKENRSILSAEQLKLEEIKKHIHTLEIIG